MGDARRPRLHAGTETVPRLIRTARRPFIPATPVRSHHEPGVISFQQHELVGEPDADETAEVRWVPIDETPEMITRGDILGAITIIGVQHALLRRAVGHVPPS